MVRLDDICAINMGQSPDSASYNENGEGMPFFQGNADFGKIHPKVRVWCSAPTKIAYAGDVLISVRAPIGAMNIADRECCIGRGLAALTVNEGLCVKDYLWYAIASKVDELNSKGTGSTFKAISKGVLAETEIPLPDLNEQKKIAEQLAKVDGLIAARKEQLTKLDQLVKSRFIELFGEPIANQKKLPVKPLKEISTLITNGNTPKGGSENYVENGIIFLRSQNVWRNNIVLDDVAYIDDETHESMKKSSVHHKDILITKTGRINTENSSLGRAALYLGADDSANINGHVYLVRLDDTVVPEYVVTILTGEAYRRYIRKVCVGGIDKRQINLDQVEEFPIILPPKEQQEKFATFVNQIDKSKFDLKQSLEKLETLKKSLMQQYFG